MLARWQQVLEKFGALSARERTLILVAIFAACYQLADMVILERQFEQIEQLNRAMAQDNQEIARVNLEMNALAGRVQNDPNRGLRRRIKAERDQVRELQTRLQEATGDLISPQDMARFLEQLLIQEDQLTMLRLQTLEVEPLLGDADDGTGRGSVQAALHRHGFEIEFSGGYLATLRYLKTLEALPWRFFWDSVDYEVLEYPESVVRLKLYTLSLSEDWIGV